MHIFHPTFPDFLSGDFIGAYVSTETVFIRDAAIGYQRKQTPRARIQKRTRKNRKHGQKDTFPLGCVSSHHPLRELQAVRRLYVQSRAKVSGTTRYFRTASS